jgi:hypothetical protein
MYRQLENTREILDVGNIINDVWSLLFEYVDTLQFYMMYLSCKRFHSLITNSKKWSDYVQNLPVREMALQSIRNGYTEHLNILMQRSRWILIFFDRFHDPQYGMEATIHGQLSMLQFLDERKFLLQLSKLREVVDSVNYYATFQWIMTRFYADWEKGKRDKKRLQRLTTRSYRST